jgi:DNA-binding SARP family transcriptional activator
MRVPARPRRRATIQTFRAEVLHALGRDADATAALDEAAELARRLGDDRLAAYAAWEAAKGAARRGEHDRTLALLDEVHAHRGPWFEHPTGMVFLADAAECCERIGERERADALLDRADARMRELLGEDDLSVWMARAACAARSGDPDAALAALDVADRLPGLAPKDRWRPVALRAHALARRGDRAAAIPLAAAAFDLASTNGTLQVAEVLEPTVTAALRQLLAQTAPVGGPTLHVQVLGRFTLRRGEQPVPVPAGLPEALVKVLAVSGGRLHQDLVIDRLWPTGDLAGAGQRLRNVLHRLRAADVVQRDGDTIALLAPFRVDLAEFDAVSGRASGPGAAAIARRAVALYTGPLLPDDLYADWTVAPRERARRRYVDLLDLLADDAEERGDRDDALHALELAVAADPYSEHRAVRLAGIYADCERTVDALRTLDQASTMLAELGVDPSAEHRALRQVLGST